MFAVLAVCMYFFSLAFAPICSDSENLLALFWMTLRDLAHSLDAKKQWGVIASLWREQLICGPAASNSINAGLYQHYHASLGAYEEILELLSFTDHQDTRSPHFSCLKVEMLPQQLPSPTLLGSATHRWMCVHICLHNEPLSEFYTAIMLQRGSA